MSRYDATRAVYKKREDGCGSRWEPSAIYPLLPPRPRYIDRSRSRVLNNHQTRRRNTTVNQDEADTCRYSHPSSQGENQVERKAPRLDIQPAARHTTKRRPIPEPRQQDDAASNHATAQTISCPNIAPSQKKHRPIYRHASYRRTKTVPGKKKIPEPTPTRSIPQQNRTTKKKGPQPDPQHE